MNANNIGAGQHCINDLGEEVVVCDDKKGDLLRMVRRADQQDTGGTFISHLKFWIAPGGEREPIELDATQKSQMKVVEAAEDPE